MTPSWPTNPGSAPTPTASRESTVKAPRRTLRRVLRWILGLTLSLLVLVVLLVLLRNPVLKRVTQYNLRDETGMRAEIGRFDLGFSSASITITDLELFNPEEFGGASFIRIPEIHCKLSPENSTANRLAFDEIRFHLASINVVKNEKGEVNLDRVQKRQRSRARKRRRSTNQVEFAGVQRLTLNLGTLNYLDLAHPENNQTIDLNVKNKTATQIKSEQELNAWLITVFAQVAIEQYYKSPDQSKRKLLTLLKDLFRKEQ